jgi:hypothetical protein
LDTEIFNAGENQSGEGGWGPDAKEGAQHLWGKERGRSSEEERSRQLGEKVVWLQPRLMMTA